VARIRVWSLALATAAGWVEGGDCPAAARGRQFAESRPGLQCLAKPGDSQEARPRHGWMRDRQGPRGQRPPADLGVGSCQRPKGAGCPSKPTHKANGLPERDVPRPWRIRQRHGQGRRRCRIGRWRWCWGRKSTSGPAAARRRRAFARRAVGRRGPTNREENRPKVRSAIGVPRERNAADVVDARRGARDRLADRNLFRNWFALGTCQTKSGSDRRLGWG
jgi:hypothetical protein